MEYTLNQEIVLAHWTYTEREWRNFMKWKKRCQGWLHLAGHYLYGKRKLQVPDITIIHQKIWIGDDAETFNDVSRQLKNVLVTDVGKLNILTITYVVLNNGERNQREITIPVPLRKLRDAIHVCEKLKTSALR